MISRSYLTEGPFYIHLHEPGQEIREGTYSTLENTCIAWAGRGEWLMSKEN